jgi:hypothetical protein
MSPDPRITERINVDFRVPAPAPGSWVQDIVLVSAPIIAEAAVKVPIGMLVAHVFRRLADMIGGKKEALALAQQVTAQERERTAQEREKSAQAEQLSMQKALSIIEEQMRARPADDQSKLRFVEARDELAAVLTRDEALLGYEDELRRIPDEQETRLLTQVQPQLVEIGKQAICGGIERKCRRPYSGPLYRKHN